MKKETLFSFTLIVLSLVIIGLPTGNCYVPNCKTYNQTNSSHCLVCYDGYFAKNSTGLCYDCSHDCKTCLYNATNCTSCSSGTFLSFVNRYGSCEPCSVNCLECKDHFDRCTSCPSYYRLNSRYECEVSYCPLSNCQQCEKYNATRCQLCSQGYYADKNTKKCYSCPSYCLNCSDRSTCNNCTSGYYVDKWSGICKRCSSDCVTCSSNDDTYGTNCTSCQAGYFVEIYNRKGSCEECSDNCAECSGSSTYCTKCPYNYRLNSENKCEVQYCQATNCQQCMKYNATQCAVCNSRYFANKNTYQCERCASSCLTCSSYDDTYGTNCTSCQAGYFVEIYNRKGSCEECSDNCAECSGSSTYCTKCPYNYRLNSENKCEVQYCQATNCQQCMKYNATQCEVCSPRYFTTNSTHLCQPCSSSCKTCTSYDNTAGKNCTSCSTGYFVNKSNQTWYCAKCSDNCLECTERSDYCTQCATNYKLNSENKCEVSYCPLANCQQCTKYNATQCETCNQGYYVDPVSKKCNKCSSNCISCENATNCTECTAGYFVNRNTGSCSACTSNCKTCASFDDTFGANCTSCNPGTFLAVSSEMGYCLQCSENCAECYGSRNNCTKCPSNYKLNAQNECEVIFCRVSHCTQCMRLNDSQCAVCDPHYFIDQNSKRCNECSSHCLSCLDSSSCQECEEAYFVDKRTSLCSPCINGCKTCSSFDETYGSNCTSCNAGNYLRITGDLGSCPKCSENCLECYGTATYCTKCPNYYKLNEDNECEVQYCQATNCQQCMKYNATQCQICDPYYYVEPSTMKCARCSQNCLTCIDNNSCQECEPNYFVDKRTNLCSRCTNDCKTCTSLDDTFGSNCTSCSPGYFLNMTDNTGACPKCSQNCLECVGKANYCTKCPNYYKLNEDNECEVSYCPLSNCKQCMKYNATQCQICDPYYYVEPSTMKCASCPSHCVSCVNNSVCTSCSEGYFLNKSSNLCHACTNDCKTCTSNDDTFGTNCTSCSSGFFLNISDNMGYCNKCSEGCLECYGAAHNCSSCASGYFLQDFANNTSTCEKCSSNCVECTKGPSNCTKCAPGNYLVTPDSSGSRFCDSCSINCLECIDRNDKCTKCNPNYRLNSLSKCEVALCELPNCQKCTQYNHTLCQNCVSKHALNSQSQCDACPANCQECSSSTVCSSCEESHGLNETTRLCVACIENCAQCSGPNLTTQCQTCKGQFFLNEITGACDKCPLNCLECESGTCTRCKFLMSFKSKSGKCEYDMAPWVFVVLCILTAGLLIGGGVFVYVYIQKKKIVVPEAEANRFSRLGENGVSFQRLENEVI